MPTESDSDNRTSKVGTKITKMNKPATLKGVFLTCVNKASKIKQTIYLLHKLNQPFINAQHYWPNILPYDVLKHQK